MKAFKDWKKKEKQRKTQEENLPQLLNNSQQKPRAKKTAPPVITMKERTSNDTNNVETYGYMPNHDESAKSTLLDVL